MLTRFLLCWGLLAPLWLWGQADPASKSPYFVVTSAEKGAVNMPLTYTGAEINVAGTMADVRITQVYQNTGEIPLEAIYVFPASTRAAVYAMDMQVGDRHIEAKIKEKKQARQTYEKAKAKGKTASLLVQHRPNVFQMNVANIMPGDSIVIHLSYTEYLVPTEGKYELVYPTVVGPRYVGPKELLAAAGENWTGTPYTQAGADPLYKFELKAKINGGVPVQDLKSPSHQHQVSYLPDGSAEFALKEEENGGNRDVVFSYSLKGNALNSGLLTYREKGENFFLWTIQPPKRVAQQDITAREYIFIVDVSGSMHGFPLDISKAMLRDLIGNLRDTDRFNVILFAGASSIMANVQSVPATHANISKAIRFINKENGSGGTSLLPALERGLKLKETPGFARSFVLLTDGYVTVEDQAYDLMRKNLGKANFFAMGIGSSVNRALIEGLAEVGKGEPFVALNAQEGRKIAKKFREYVEAPILTDIVADFGEMDVYDIEPMGIPDVFADRPITIFGKYKGKLEGDVSLKGIAGRQPYQQLLALNKVKPTPENRALRYLWARQRIHRLSDVRGAAGKASSEKEVTELGLQYNLLTAYTSFVAVDKENRNKSGEQKTVKQALPMPQGVSNRAVGGGNNSTASAKPRTPRLKRYAPASAPVKVSGSLADENLQLSEVVVTGYSVEREVQLSGASVAYTSSQIQSLQGRAVSVQVQQQTGAPGSGSDIIIRGHSTLTGANQPLVVVDGVVQEGLDLYGTPTGSLTQGSSQSSMSLGELSAEDISSVSVLKDHAASALYGSRAASGVILIETNQAKNSGTQWEIGSKLGLQTPARKLTGSPFALQSALRQMHHLRVSHRDSKQKLRASLRFTDQPGILAPANQRKLQARLRYEREWHPRWSSEIMVNGGMSQQTGGLFNWLGIDSLRRSEADLFAQRYQDFAAHNQTRSGELSLRTSGEFLQRWSVESLVSGRLSRTGFEQYAPFSLWGLTAHEGVREESQKIQDQFQQTHHLRLARVPLGNHFGLKANWKAEQVFSRWRYSGEIGAGLNPEQPLSEANLFTPYDWGFSQVVHSLGQQVQLDWKSIWTLRANLAAADLVRGENRLGWKVFPSVMTMLALPVNRWSPNLNMLNIDVSYGQAGNQRLPVFAFGSPVPQPLSVWNPFQSTADLRRLPAENLQWETSHQWNAGIGLRFLDRWELGQAFYQKDHQNFYADVPTITNQGTFLQLSNVGSVRQRGAESRLSVWQTWRGFRLNLDMNLTFQSSEVRSLQQGSPIPTGLFHPISGEFVEIGSIEVGQPLGNFRGYRLDEQGYPIGEPEILGHALPDMFYGSQLSLGYQNYKLSLNLYGNRGQSVLNFTQPHPAGVITENMVEAGNFLRLDEVKLRAKYRLRQLGHLTVEAGVSNLWLWTNYSGFDPEVNVLGSQQAMLMGVDAWAYPRARTFWLGLSLAIE
ncbi:MAG: TonB-dependent receptor [Bacteroidota bacterium]